MLLANDLGRIEVTVDGADSDGGTVPLAKTRTAVTESI